MLMKKGPFVEVSGTPSGEAPGLTPCKPLRGRAANIQRSGDR